MPADNPATNRYLAVDFYRGLTVAFMILVNTPGTGEFVYAPLRHADWHGCTPTDLVFPSFMFIIGVSMWFAFGKFDRKWSAEAGIKILKRTALLFFIGLILNNFPRVWDHWDTWRIMGVPQRLALGYGLASVLVLNFERRTLLWISGTILVVYWAMLYFLGLPGADPYALDANAVLRFDRFLFTDAHLWKGERIPFDPEGVLSTLPAVVTVLLGWFSGGMLQRRGEQKDALVRDLLLFGLAIGFAGLLWDLTFPINKKLWTSSYVLYAGGMSMILLAACIWFLDVRGWRNGAGFFLTFGANALFAYVLSEALVMLWADIRWVTEAGTAMDVRSWIYITLFRPLEGGAFSSFLFAVVYTLLCWLFCRWLYVRNIYIKL
ncbi:MAG: hypothetical protein IT270_06000 [Saprospiraceae bacterium]|nr:hypothetical protein [Saprospiraceae bacterium]